MPAADRERWLVEGLAALEDARADVLRTFEALERVDAQMTWAAADVEGLTALTAGGEQTWAQHAAFASVVLDQATHDGSEVAVALADSGIARREVSALLDSATEHLADARESMAKAEGHARAEGDSADVELAVTIETLVGHGHRAVSDARAAMRQVDDGAVAAQALLATRVSDVTTASSVAVGASTQLEQATAGTRRGMDSVDAIRDRATESARILAEVGGETRGRTPPTENGPTTSHRDAHDRQHRPDDPTQQGRGLS